MGIYVIMEVIKVINFNGNTKFIIGPTIQYS